jgi:hypothetical protein
MKMRLIAPWVLATLSTSCLAAGLVTPEPGMWEQSTQLSPDGKTWRPGVRTKGCLSAEQATQWESQVRQQIAAANCTVSSLAVAGGRISGVIACTSINQPTVSISGIYTGDAYSVDLASSGVVDLTQVGGSSQTPVKAFARWTGKHLGAC